MAKRYRLCCLTKNRTNPAYVGAQIGARRLAERLGCELQGFAPKKPDDIEEQRAQILAAIATKPDAILVSPVDPAAVDEVLAAVREAGIVLVYFVASSECVPAHAFITSDNYALARDIAGYLVDHIGRRGDVAILEGLPQSPTTAPRTRAFLDVIGEHPGIDLVARAVGNYQLAEGKTAMAEILRKHDGLRGVISANDAMALGALEAIAEAGRSVTITGMNAMPDAIKAIKAGKLLATVSFDALSLVAMAVQAAVRILDGDPVPDVVSLDAEVIDATNCAAWDRPYEDRPIPDWDSAVAGARRGQAW
jgi:ribose transport system substrate-binding protein